MEAVPLMMACSIVANLWALRRNIQWEGSLLLIVGGALGIPIAIYLLQNAETDILQIAFGIIAIMQVLARALLLGRQACLPSS